VEYEEY
jgi:hypothetical protein